MAHVPTAADVQDLMNQLDKDLERVNKDRRINPGLQQSIGQTIGRLKPRLVAVKRQLEAGSPPDWPPSAEVFRELTPLLAQALSPSPETGKCVYDGGCIQTTSTQCADIGGQFTKGAHCP